MDISSKRKKESKGKTRICRNVILYLEQKIEKNPIDPNQVLPLPVGPGSSVSKIATNFLHAHLNNAYVEQCM